MGSAFKPFKLQLSNGAITTGIASIPPSSSTTTSTHQTAKPLIVGLHGGTCTSAYFNLSPEYSAAKFSGMTGIPFVAINRPCYADSTSLLPLAENEPWFSKLGHWLNDYILPAAWKEFGIPNNCTGLVMISHSMPVPPTIFCAGLHAEQGSAAQYPLAGIIVHGWGVQHGPVPNFDVDTSSGSVTPPWPDIKINMMLGNPASPDCPAEVLDAVKQQEKAHNVPMPLAEIGQIEPWLRDAAMLSGKVTVPVMYAGGDKDTLWVITDETLRAFAERFTSSAKVDAKMIHGAPHSLEWGWSAYAWYLQVFGWASEVCVELELSK